MAGFVTAYQRIVIQGTWPAPAPTAALAVVALATGATGLAVFARHQRRFAELV